MLIPSYAAIQEAFDIPESLIAIPDAMFVFSSALFALVWGYYTDRVDRLKVILAGAFAWTIGMLLTAFSGNFLMLVFSRMLSGVGLGCVLPVGYSIISDVVPPEERSGWFGMVAILSSVSNGIGQALSAFIGPIFGQEGWRVPFFILAIVSIIIVFLLFFAKIPKRGASESELLDLTTWNLEYSYTISKKDLKDILSKKTNRYLIIQGFFSIIPGTIFIYFLTSMITIHYFNTLPIEIRLQTATIFAGLVGVGYILGNLIFSRLGDILFKRNKKNRARLATICMILTIPFCLFMLFFLEPVDASILGLPPTIPPDELTYYIFYTIGQIFTLYPFYILYFIFALIGSMLSAAPVANRNAVMVDVNLPEHRGTAASFFNLSEQIGKGITLTLSFILVTLLGSIFNMMVFSVLFWIPAGLLWFLASKKVKSEMDEKSSILSERKQLSLMDFVFELELQMDRAIQKVQDSKYYLVSTPEKFNALINDAIKILKYCIKESKLKKLRETEQKATKINDRASSIKVLANQIYEILSQEDLSDMERNLLNEDLDQLVLMIAEGEKSSFGELQIFYEDAYIKILEARLLRKKDLIKCLEKIVEAINIYLRVKNFLDERTELVSDKKDISQDDLIMIEKQQDLYDKNSKALAATNKLKEEFEEIFKQLKAKGIAKNDLTKISELTLEYNVDFYRVIIDTFGQDQETKVFLMELLRKVDMMFDDYDEFREIELKVF